MSIDERIDLIGRHPFRARFHLRRRERAIVKLRGMSAVRGHAADLVAKRVAPAQPRNDGKQTPYRGHPVFVAQHATATCCRGCLAKWHDIPRGSALTDEQTAHVIAVIERWLRGESRLAQLDARL